MPLYAELRAPHYSFIRAPYTFIKNIALNNNVRVPNVSKLFVKYERKVNANIEIKSFNEVCKEMWTASAPSILLSIISKSGLSFAVLHCAVRGVHAYGVVYRYGFQSMPPT